jgi:uncharacterized protein YcnI
MNTRVLARVTAAAGSTALVLALAAAPASAHIGTSTDSVPAGSTIALGLTVGHGCDESPTREVAIQIPEGIYNATPFAHPGWAVASERETLATPVTSAHGDEVTDRVSVITFTAEAGNELPDGVRDTFSVNFTAPETPGETLFFKTVQTCVDGSTSWIEEYDGEGEEPEHPAPTVTVTEPEAEDGHGSGSEAEDESPTDVTTSGEADGEGSEASTADGGDSDSGKGLAVAGIVLGGLGVATGGAALAKTRKA